MLHTITFVFALAAILCAALPAAAPAADFEQEEIKPYIKVMDGPWLGNSTTGQKGAYTIHVQIPPNTRYALGLFDNKINRAGADERSAVVLVDGANPLAPAEKLPSGAINPTDVRNFKKYPLDGATFTARDTSGKDAFVKVVDAKEEWEVGAVKPFTTPQAQNGGSLGRIDIFLFAAPAQPPTPGGTVAYGAPFLRYTMLLK